MRRHGGDLNANVRGKEANLKRLPTIFYVYDILEKAKLQKRWKGQWLPVVKGSRWSTEDP